MKSVLLSLSALFIALLSLNSVSAQAVKFHAKEPPTVTIQPVSDGTNINFQICISGTLYGCGDASSISASLNITGNSDNLCFNKGNDNGPVPGQSGFTVSSPTLNFAATNGHAFFSLCVTITGSCKGGGMDHYEVTGLRNLAGSLLVNGVTLDVTRFLN